MRPRTSLSMAGSAGPFPADALTAGPLPPLPARPRDGFTLVEMIVAILVLVIGVLGLAASSAIVVRQIGGGAQQSLIAATAQNRFERMKSMNCADIVAGSEQSRGISERWVITAVGTATRTVVDSLTYNTPRGERTSAYSTVVTCII